MGQEWSCCRHQIFGKGRVNKHTDIDKKNWNPSGKMPKVDDDMYRDIPLATSRVFWKDEIITPPVKIGSMSEDESFNISDFLFTDIELVRALRPSSNQERAEHFKRFMATLSFILTKNVIADLTSYFVFSKTEVNNINNDINGICTILREKNIISTDSITRLTSALHVTNNDRVKRIAETLFTHFQSKGFASSPTAAATEDYFQKVLRSIAFLLTDKVMEDLKSMFAFSDDEVDRVIKDRMALCVILREREIISTNYISPLVTALFCTDNTETSKILGDLFTRFKKRTFASSSVSKEQEDCFQRFLKSLSFLLNKKVVKDLSYLFAFSDADMDTFGNDSATFCRILREVGIISPNYVRPLTLALHASKGNTKIGHIVEELFRLFQNGKLDSQFASKAEEGYFQRFLRSLSFLLNKEVVKDLSSVFAFSDADMDAFGNNSVTFCRILREVGIISPNYVRPLTLALNASGNYRIKRTVEDLFRLFQDRKRDSECASKAEKGANLQSSSIDDVVPSIQQKAAHSEEFKDTLTKFSKKISPSQGAATLKNLGETDTGRMYLSSTLPCNKMTGVSNFGPPFKPSQDITLSSLVPFFEQLPKRESPGGKTNGAKLQSSSIDDVVPSVQQKGVVPSVQQKAAHSEEFKDTLTKFSEKISPGQGAATLKNLGETDTGRMDLSSMLPYNKMAGVSNFGPLFKPSQDITLCYFVPFFEQLPKREGPGGKTIEISTYRDRLFEEKISHDGDKTRTPQDQEGQKGPVGYGDLSQDEESSPEDVGSIQITPFKHPFLLMAPHAKDNAQNNTQSMDHNVGNTDEVQDSEPVPVDIVKELTLDFRQHQTENSMDIDDSDDEDKEIFSRAGSLKCLEATTSISKEGGFIAIPYTEVELQIQPNSFLREDEIHLITVKILPRRLFDKPASCFEDHSTVMVEILPNNLKLQRAAKLTLPHCLILRDPKNCDVQIFHSHHNPDQAPQWKNITMSVQHELSTNVCHIWVENFSWIKYNVGGREIEGKKLFLYTLGKRYTRNSKFVTAEVGYFPALPGNDMIKLEDADFITSSRGTRFESKLRKMFQGDWQTFVFWKEPKTSLQISVSEINPDDGWKTSSTCPKYISYQDVEISNEQSQPFTFKRQEDEAPFPVIHFKVCQGEKYSEIYVDMEEGLIQDEQQVPPDQQRRQDETNMQQTVQTDNAQFNSHENSVTEALMPVTEAQQVQDTQMILSPNGGIAIRDHRAAITWYQHMSTNSALDPSNHLQAWNPFQRRLLQPQLHGSQENLPIFSQLSPSDILKLGNYLDTEHPLGVDWRKLADILGFNCGNTWNFQRNRSPTEAVIMCACQSGKLRTKDQLLQVLEDMGRLDAKLAISDRPIRNSSE